jgi:NAD(P)H-hydrate epimerase
MEIVKQNILKQIYKPRPEWSHKGNFGHLLVVGGSKKYSGSPAFNALAAYRSGVDLVTVAAPKRAADIIASFSPDLITHPLDGDYFDEGHLKEVLELAKNANAVAIGGGLERYNSTMSAVRKFMKKTNLPCVIDADAIHAFKKKVVIKRNFVITPHSNEFFTLTGIKPEEDIERRIDAVKNVANQVGCVMVLKGHVDVISDGMRTAINNTGNPYMTVGGTGDTLTGICGALLARGVTTFEAACAACFINGMAGDLAAKKYGEGLMASDLISEIPNVIKRK